MRAKSVQPEGAASTAATTKPARGNRARNAGLAVLALAVFAAAWLMRPKETQESAANGPAPLTTGELKAALAAEQVQADGMEKLLEPSAAIEAFAEAKSQGKKGPQQVADAVYEAYRARARAMAFVPWSLGEPRTTAVMTAADVHKTIVRDAVRAELYPLELSALLTSALRSQAVPAVIAELTDVPGRKSPLDPSGYFGYFVVAVYPEAVGAGTPKLLDLYGGEPLPPGAQFKVLTDTAVIGAALGLRALHENTYLADPRKALSSSSHALRLAGTLPSVRTTRGVVVLGEKMLEQGLQEFQAARDLRADAPRLHNLATVMLVTGDVERAQGLLASALQLTPDYPSARATLATLQTLSGHPEEALTELQKAERAAPNLTLVQWAYADYHVRRGEPEEALARARRAYAMRPSLDAKLRLAVLLRQTSKYDEMRKLAEEMVQGVPGYRRDDLRNVVGAVLGPTALEPDLPAQPDMAADDLADLGDVELKLNQPGEKLQTGAESEGQTSGQDAPKLRLREPAQGLRLKLGDK